MATFLHNLMEGLRGREKYLEQKMSDVIAEKKRAEPYMAQLESLQSELDKFKQKISDLHATDKDYDEHFESTIKDDRQELEVKIDAWTKSWSERSKD